MPFAATCLDLEIILSEVSRREIQVSYNITYIWYKWAYLWNRNRLTDTENKLVAAKKERGEEGMDQEFGISWCKLSYREQTTLHSIPCVKSQWKRILKKNVCVCIYIKNWIILLYSRNQHNIVHQLYFNNTYLWTTEDLLNLD